MDFIVPILINAVAVFVAAYVLPGVTVKNFLHALLAAVVLALANVLVRPILEFISFPLTVITLGLFRLVISALILMLVDWILPGLKIKNFLWAVLFAVVIALVNLVLGWIF